tara:strand:+ start:2183 stop:3370 length:1188 start_codon:yes stop_codon:yes gene_type:complete
MDFGNIKAYIKEKTDAFAFSNLKEKFRKKHQLRLRIYETLLDYMNTPGATGDNGYFSWYKNQLNRRADKSPYIARAYFKVRKIQNDQTFRDFLQHCMNRIALGDDMKAVLRDFMPDDEYNLYLSNTKSDQRPIMDALTVVCKDKIATSKLIGSIITSNLFIILFSVIVHVVVYNALYKALLPAEVLYLDAVPDRELTPMEWNYYKYKLLIDYWYFFLGGVVSFIVLLLWSNKNWSNRGVKLREELFDFLPPYSIRKLKTQYEIVMMLYYNLESGKKWLESLELIKKLSTPYAKYQIDKIIRRTPTHKPNEALNIFYMGAAGDYIDSRSAGLSFVDVLGESVISLQLAKMELIEGITNTIKKFIVLPLVWGGIALSTAPVIIHIISIAKEAQSAAG